MSDPVANIVGQTYEQILTSHEPDRKILWCHLKSSPRPCFTPVQLENIAALQRAVKREFYQQVEDAESAIEYLVFDSAVPGVFSLGGDLDLFRRCIRERDRRGLEQYARQCIHVLHTNSCGFDIPITTVSLVQGRALGGGFEGALSSNVLVAERSAEMGFPEVLFNLFPGMGAYSLVARKAGQAVAERLIFSGDLYRAEELYEMGVVDVLAEDGEGKQAVYDYMRQSSRFRNTHQAMRRVRQRYNPMAYAELADIADIWVDAALRLRSKDLRTMERLVRAQDRLIGNASKAARSRQDVA